MKGSSLLIFLSLVAVAIAVLMGAAVSRDSWEAVYSSIKDGRWSEPQRRGVVFSRHPEKGTVEIDCHNEEDLMWAMGYAHAMDRGVQMGSLRVIGQGRMSELLISNDVSLKIDSFMRDLSFAHHAAHAVSKLSPEGKRLLQAYADGVNFYGDHYPRPFEFLLVGLDPEPWTVADSLMLVKLMTYAPLAEVQRDTEGFILQGFKAGVNPDVLKALFSPHLDGVTDELLQLYSKVNIGHFTIPNEVRFLPGLPRGKASNNWVVSPKKSVSGKALGASDPHLDTARLPAFWAEMKSTVNGHQRFGITFPGVPSYLFGGTKHLMASFTYGFMDMVDFFIEDIRREGEDVYSYRRGENEWLPVKVRKETIKRQGMPSIEQTFLEVDNCVLETQPLYNDEQLANGLYVCRAWADDPDNVASVEAILKVPKVKTVHQAQELLKDITLSANHLLVDDQGNIGYQQSGALPARRSDWSGLYPLPGWDEKNLWKGFVPKNQLIRVNNPESGILATANHDVKFLLNETERDKYPLSINLRMGYRIDRLNHLLTAKEKFDLEDFKAMQLDLYSVQAEIFMKVLTPYLEQFKEDKVARELLGWDRRYDVSSKGAPIFEAIYSQLHSQFYGEKIFGKAPWEYFTKETAIFADYFVIFDDFLLSYPSSDPFGFYKEESKEAFFKRAIQSVFSSYEEPFPTWGKVREVKMKNMFFDGALPPFLGFDHVYEQPGNGATLRQGAYYHSKGRMVTFAPSWRAVFDMGRGIIETALPGGPSGDRFSWFYKTGLQEWIDGTYFSIKLD